MSLESASYIWELVDTNPEGADPVAEGDNHLRMIKLCLQNTFPNMSAPWTTSDPINCADPVAPQDVVTKHFLDVTGGMAIGFPFIWMLDTLPANCLDLKGQVINRVTYATLFALYGTTYGAGDGSTTFKLPDMRGLFMRVRDDGAGIDPNAATRTNRGDGTTGDAVGTKQADQVGTHTHNITANISIGGGVAKITSGNGSVPTAGAFQTDAMATLETRPVNVYVRLIIRAL